MRRSIQTECLRMVLWTAATLAGAFLGGCKTAPSVVFNPSAANSQSCPEPASWVALKQSSATLAAQISKAATLNVSHSDQYVLHQFNSSEDFSKELAEYNLCLERRQAAEKHQILNPVWEDWYRQYWVKAVGESGFSLKDRPDKYLADANSSAISCDNLGSSQTLKDVENLVGRAEDMIHQHRDDAHYITTDEQTYVVTRSQAFYEINHLAGGTAAGHAGIPLAFFWGSTEPIGSHRIYNTVSHKARPFIPVATNDKNIASSEVRVAGVFDLTEVTEARNADKDAMWIVINPTRFTQHESSLLVNVLLDWDVADGEVAFYMLRMDQGKLVCQNSIARVRRLDPHDAQALQSGLLQDFSDPTVGALQKLTIRSGLNLDLNPGQMFVLIIPIHGSEGEPLASDPSASPVFVHTSYEMDASTATKK